MLIFNAIFAAYEMALASISRARLLTLTQQKKKGAEEASYMKDRMESSLAVVQIGITFVGAIAAATGGAAVTESLEPVLQSKFGFSETVAEILSLTCLIIPLSGLTIILAELVPKIFALNNKEWVCLVFSPAMKVFSQFGYPIVVVFEWFVKKIVGYGSKKWKPEGESYDKLGLHELKAAVTLARASRLIEAGQEKIVLSAAQLSSRPVSDIILPAADISMIPVNLSLSDALIRAHLDMHTRFPICQKEGNPQTIIGYVNFKDIVNVLKNNPTDPSLKGIVMPIQSFFSDTKLSKVLEQMIQERVHIALVTAEDKKVLGMITLEDIIEELVGEIEDEFDRLPTHIHPYGATWIMGGGVQMNTVAATLQIDWFKDPAQARIPTLAEWFGKRLGRQPKGGEIIESDHICVMLRKLRRKKLFEAIVSVAK